MEIQKVRDIHMLIAKGIVRAIIGIATGRIVIDLNALHLKFGVYNIIFLFINK